MTILDYTGDILATLILIIGPLLVLALSGGI